MKSKIPSIRPLKRSDIGKFKNHGYSFRGIAVELDGEFVGVAGVLHSAPLQAFSKMDDKLRKYPKTIVKVMIAFEDILNKYELPVYAMTNDQENNSPRVLERVGFKHLRRGMYKWHKQ